MDERILEIENLRKRYSILTLKDINLSLPPGKIGGIIGAGNSGKSTLLKLLMGGSHPDSGNIRIFGKELLAHEESIKIEMAYIGETSIFSYLWTANTIGKILSSFYPSWNQEEYDKLLANFELPGNVPIVKFNRTMILSLMLVAALSRESRLLLIDEPLAGVDPSVIPKVLEALKDYLKPGNRSILYAARKPFQLESITDVWLYLENKENSYE